MKPSTTVILDILKYLAVIACGAALAVFTLVVLPSNMEREVNEDVRMSELVAVVDSLAMRCVCPEVEYVVENVCAAGPEDEVVSFLEPAYHGRVIDLPFKN